MALALAKAEITGRKSFGLKARVASQNVMAALFHVKMAKVVIPKSYFGVQGNGALEGSLVFIPLLLIHESESLVVEIFGLVIVAVLCA